MLSLPIPQNQYLRHRTHSLDHVTYFPLFSLYFAHYFDHSLRINLADKIKDYPASVFPLRILLLSQLSRSGLILGVGPLQALDKLPWYSFCIKLLIS